jgi:hypothetical protein
MVFKTKKKTTKSRIAINKQSQKQNVVVNVHMVEQSKKRKRRKKVSVQKPTGASRFSREPLTRPVDVLSNRLHQLVVQPPVQNNTKLEIAFENLHRDFNRLQMNPMREMVNQKKYDSPLEGLEPNADYNETDIGVAESFYTPLKTPTSAYSQRAGRTPEQTEELRAYGLKKLPKSFDDAEASLERHRRGVAKSNNKMWMVSED